MFVYGTQGLTLLESKGFRAPEKLPGIPACDIIGKFEFRLRGGHKYRSFNILWGDLVNDLDTGDTFRLSKELTSKVCKTAMQKK